MQNIFGSYVREKREALREGDPEYSIRKTALRLGIAPSHLSRIERGDTEHLAEQKIIALADDLGEDPDILLALAGKVSSEIQRIIRKRPKLFADLIRQIDEMPDHAILRIVREVRDGDW
jgi:transcriptional regulator with XRE-family HTH domain